MITDTGIIKLRLALAGAGELLLQLHACCDVAER